MKVTTIEATSIAIAAFVFGLMIGALIAGRPDVAFHKCVVDGYERGNTRIVIHDYCRSKSKVEATDKAGLT